MYILFFIYFAFFLSNSSFFYSANNPFSTYISRCTLSHPSGVKENASGFSDSVQANRTLTSFPVVIARGFVIVPPMKCKTIQAEAMLMITAAVWGLGFVFQRQGMEFLPPHLYNAARFLLGGTLLLPLGILQFRHDRSHRTAAPLWVLLLSSVAAGTVLFIASSLQQMGIVYTTSSKAGFITGLYVVLVPIIGWIFRQRITGFVWIGAIFAAAGLYLLCIDGPLQLQHGDMLILACAFVWALHVHVIGHCTRFGNPCSAGCRPVFILCRAGPAAVRLHRTMVYHRPERRTTCHSR